MQMVDDARVVVYLMTGFLESGKTTFLADTLGKNYFKIDGKTVVILCEEGEVEYEESLLDESNTELVVVDEPEDLTPELLQEIEDKYHPERVIIECNGMYPVSKVEEVDAPEGWGLIQEITTVDASSFDVYIANMKSLFVEMVRNADMVVFNRCNADMPLASYRRSVKVVNQGAEIIFENEEGEIEDIFSDQLPFDIDAPVVKIEDMDFGIWYVDMMENVETYIGKTIEFNGKARKVKGFPKDELVVGRSAMTCCADDLQFLGFISKNAAFADFDANTWVKVRGTVRFEHKKAYRGKGPVLYLDYVEKIPALEEELVYFN